MNTPENTSDNHKIERPVIFDYLNYRNFLNDMFNFRKQKNYHFSYRVFSEKAGFSSPNFLKLVINGQRNLTNASVGNISKGFDLKKQEREFFENLVFMNQASNHDEKNHYFTKMMSINGYIKSHKLEKSGYEYFSKWYYPAIREIVTFGNRKLLPEEIAKRLTPGVTQKEVEKALNLLSDLGLIQKNRKGEWEQVDKVVTTGPEVRSMIISNYHKEMIKLGIEAIEGHPPDERDISGITVSVKKERIADIKNRIMAFRKELLKLACEDEGADQVLQINIQAFPLTK